MTSIDTVVAALERVAPPALAAPWDNVGLLLQGSCPVARAWLCIDLTEPVLAEALAAQADLIIAYHPILFTGARRLTDATPQGRVALGAVRAGVHVYSPHTALDAAADGVNDWLLEAFGARSDVAPLQPSAVDPVLGAGRRAALAAPTPLGALVDAIKAHLGLVAVRIAAPPALADGSRSVRTVATCPGAGAGVFEGVDGVDLFLTGELRHHDVLARVASGSAVVLTDHTNTERGFLPRLAGRLSGLLPQVQFRCSMVDADPLQVG